jgi:hypothetical protein
MSRSYSLLTLASVVLGGLLVIDTFAFGGSVATWIAFGLSVAALGTSLAIATSNRVYAAADSLVSAWTILVSLGIFSGSTQTWLIFAGGAAIAAAGVIGNARGERHARLVAVPTDIKAAA